MKIYSFIFSLVVINIHNVLAQNNNYEYDSNLTEMASPSPTISNDETLHNQCLEELAPYKDCSVDINTTKFVEFEAKIQCDQYQKSNCREFFKSPFTYAPTCKKTMKKHYYPLLNIGNGAEREWRVALKNLYCSRKDSNNFCRLYDIVIYLSYNRYYNIDDYIIQSCQYKECRESLKDYFKAYINIGYCEDKEHVKDYQKKINYLF